MLTRYKSHSYLFVALLFLFTCNNENPQPLKPVITAGFQEYVDRFISEAAKRGVKIDDSHLSVTYSDTLKYYCGYGLYSTNQAQISTRTGCWQNQTDLNKEILMFHELGHALLGRSHDNTTLPNGDYKTMMVGGNQFNLYTADTPEKREYYLDELFRPLTLAPSWSAAKTNPTIVFRDTVSTASNVWTYVRTTGSSQQGALTASVFLSPSSSLQIASTGPSALSYWYYEFTPQGIKQSDKLVLTVNIRVESVTEGGVYFALRGDSDSNNIFFATTQRATKITGTSGFKEYSVTVPYFVSTASKIYVYLMMDPQATGKVNFDDITVTKYE